MAELLASAQLLCEPDGTDRYGRLLAHCAARGLDLGTVMVSEGLAIASGQYWKEEQMAREAKIGIWQGGFETPRSWRQDHSGAISIWSWVPFLPN